MFISHVINANFLAVGNGLLPWLLLICITAIGRPRSMLIYIFRGLCIDYDMLTPPKINSKKGWWMTWWCLRFMNGYKSVGMLIYIFFYFSALALSRNTTCFHNRGGELLLPPVNAPPIDDGLYEVHRQFSITFGSVGVPYLSYCSSYKGTMFPFSRGYAMLQKSLGSDVDRKSVV